MIEQPTAVPAIVYPDSDGMPMADNTKQFRAIVTIQGNLDAIFRERDDV
ncbi:MAG: Uma2 family endonuclease, partial [Chloroflexus sp.]